jgi:uroporphyrinogen-III synthase
VTRVALTHPEPRVGRIAAALRARGHEVAILSTRRLTPLPFGPDLAEALEDEQWAVFVSPGAVETALDLLDGHWPETVGLAVIGPGSAHSLAERGIAAPRYRIVAPPAPPFDADALMRQPPFAEPAGLRIVVLRGERGRTDWMDALRARGARVSALSIYRSEAIAPSLASLAPLEAWRRGAADATFVFSSADGIEGAEAVLRARDCLEWAHGQRALAVHPRLVRLLRDAGWSRAIEASPGEPALIAAIEST